MAKETFYFRHDYNARNDDKILELRAKFGSEGYGIFWMIIETMAENENGGAKASLMGGLSLGYGVAMGRLMEIIGCCLSIGLLYEDAGYYYSKRLLTHKEFRKNLSQFGSEGANKRWGGNRGANGEANGGGNAKERKGKENKGISFDEENFSVIFKDGSTQQLGIIQKVRLENNDIKPEEILKGVIS
ncbi:MAG: Lin1244/Lin1753 domain-containing protein [Ferruginibacter sp.]